MTDEQLSDTFKRDLPSQSDGKWAEDARRRHGRRRAAVGGLAVVAALAVVSPFALQLLDRGGDTAVPASTGSESGAPSEAPSDRDAACAGAAEAGVEELPTSAVRLWLCDEPGEVGSARTGPQEPLTQGVDEALAAFHNLEKASPNLACTAEYVLTYVVVAEGVDGTLTPVSGGLHGCRTVGDRLGADGFLAQLGQLWQAQRAAEPAPSDPLAVEQLCSAPTPILPATVEGATQGALCEANLGLAQEHAGLALPPDLMERVQASIAEGGVQGALGEWDPAAYLVLANPWGERLTLTRFASGAYQFNDRIWRPQGDLAAELDALLDELGTPAVPPRPEPATCEEQRADSLSSPGSIEGAVESVMVCVENREGEPRWVGPGGGLWEPQFVQEAVAAFNDLPALVGECEDTTRADVFVTYQGAEGPVATVQVTSCGPATGAVTKDGASYVETLYQLVREQAGEFGVGMHFGAQELCPQLNSLVPFDPVAEGATQIVACVGSDGELPVDLPSELVEAMAADITTQPLADELEPEGGTLVWANKYGDPMTMVRLSDGSFAWYHDDQTEYQWTPSLEVKAQLDRIFGL